MRVARDGRAAGAGEEGAAEHRACDGCLARAWLLARLAGHLELARGRIEPVLSLADEELIAAVGGDQRDSVLRELRRLDVDQVRARSVAAGLALICPCDPQYPPRLAAIASRPAVLHVAGRLDRFLDLVAADPVAIVGSRRASPYGLDVARALGRGLASAGVTVVSGMALGIDSAGALEARGPTVAVLPAGADRPYPRGKRALHAQIRKTGVAVSELPPRSGVRRWTFPARNRIIAGLGAMTVVVEAGARSGALLTAASASALGRPVGAVPGRVTSSLATGTNGLLAAGAHLVRGPQDVLDALFGAGARIAKLEQRPPLAPELRPLLAAIGDGHDTAAALTSAGLTPHDGLAALAALELAGYVRREAGGRYVALASPSRKRR